jgi:hypothetical protein
MTDVKHDWICLAEKQPPYLCLCEWTTNRVDWFVLCEYQHLAEKRFSDKHLIFWRLTGIGKMQTETIQ